MSDNPILTAASLQRISRFIASGESPRGKFVRADTLRKVIQSCAGAKKPFRESILAIVEEHVIKGRTLVDSFQLGLFFGSLSNFVKGDDFTAICNDIRDQNKLPIVESNGRVIS